MKIAKNITLAVGVYLLSLMFLFWGAIRANAYVTIGAEIPVYCLEVSDNNTHIYEIKIESENNNSPVSNSDTLTITENGTGYFEININEPGTFTYKIYEIAGNNPNIEYDSSIYHVTLFVENSEDNELIYTVVASIVGKNRKPEKVNFEDAVMAESGSQTTTTVPDAATVTEATPDSSSITKSSAQTTVVTTVVTTTTSDYDKNSESPITEFIDSVLTGDSFRVHAVRMAMLSSILIAISTFLFKRDNSEEEDKNEK